MACILGTCVSALSDYDLATVYQACSNSNCPGYYNPATSNRDQWCCPGEDALVSPDGLAAVCRTPTLCHPTTSDSIFAIHEHIQPQRRTAVRLRAPFAESRIVDYEISSNGADTEGCTMTVFDPDGIDICKSRPLLCPSNFTHFVYRPQSNADLWLPGYGNSSNWKFVFNCPIHLNAHSLIMPLQRRLMTSPTVEILIRVMFSSPMWNVVYDEDTGLHSLVCREGRFGAKVDDVDCAHRYKPKLPHNEPQSGTPSNIIAGRIFAIFTGALILVWIGRFCFIFHQWRKDHPRLPCSFRIGRKLLWFWMKQYTALTLFMWGFTFVVWCADLTVRLCGYELNWLDWLNGAIGFLNFALELKFHHVDLPSTVVRELTDCNSEDEESNLISSNSAQPIRHNQVAPLPNTEEQIQSHQNSQPSSNKSIPTDNPLPLINQITATARSWLFGFEP